MRISGNDLTKLASQTRDRLARPGRLLIGGEWCAAAGGRTIPVVDPSSGDEISSIAAAGVSDVDDAVHAAQAAMDGPWGAMPPSERERLMWLWSDLVEANAQTLAELEVVDVGMPFWVASRLNLTGTLAAIRYMAGWPTKIAGRTVDVRVPIPGSEFFGYTTREPVGVVGAIIPWNVPLMMAAWKIAPALAAGCAVVVKPSEVAGLSILLLADLARQAGIPDGVINVLTGYGPEAGEALVRHPGVAKITFTGSTATGIHIAKAAAESVKKVTLELGGKSPQILFADADLDTALPGISDAMFLNSGQVCVAGTRLYVQRAILDETVERLGRKVESFAVGPGLDERTEIGPLVSRAQQQRVLNYIQSAEQDGASVVGGAPEIQSDGFYVRPVVVANARQSMKVAREEIFGPVLTVLPFDDFDEAVTLANDTAYGLAACVWTRDLATAHRMIPRIKSGKVAVNSDPMPYPALPEGGRKASGYGRDLGSEAVDGFLETKSVLIRLS